MPGAPDLVHGTAIAAGGRAVLLRGPSGSGKSDLALRCLALAPGPLIEQPFQLVADDQVKLLVRNGRVLVSAPLALHGLIEVRGLGIRRVPCINEAELCLIVDLVNAEDVERLPNALPAASLLGLEIQRISLTSFENSSPLKVAMALQGSSCGP